MKVFMPGVRIGRVRVSDRKDVRGETWFWTHKNPALQTVICRRKAGSKSCHVHRGVDPSKNPEWLFIAFGKVRFTFWNQLAGDKRDYLAEAGTVIAINPNIDHRTVVLSYAITLESRSTKFDKKNPDQEGAEIK